MINILDILAEKMVKFGSFINLYFFLSMLLFLDTYSYIITVILFLYVQKDLESEKTFLRTMSHEIRTPMNTVKLGIDLLRKEMQETGMCTGDMHNILGDITDSSDVIIDLVSDILTNDKLMKGTLQVNKTRIRAWHILHSASKPFICQVAR